jgi:hypothetical protein
MKCESSPWDTAWILDSTISVGLMNPYNGNGSAQSTEQTRIRISARRNQLRSARNPIVQNMISLTIRTRTDMRRHVQKNRELELGSIRIHSSASCSYVSCLPILRSFTTDPTLNNKVADCKIRFFTCCLSNLFRARRLSANLGFDDS